MVLMFALASTCFGQGPPSTPMAAKVGIFRNGYFWLEDVDGYGQFTQPPDRAFAFGGIAGDIPITGDWTGSGTTKVGIYRASNGLFILDSNGNQVVDAGDAVFSLGYAGATPVVGDWNGDGRTKVGVYMNGTWYLDFYGNQTVSRVYSFGGIAGDIPVAGDWTGSGTSKIGIFRSGYFWMLDTNGNGQFDGGDQAFPFGGISGDVPVVGDWNGDRRTKVGVFRYGYFWVLDNNGDQQFGPGDLAFAFGGIAGDVPVVGKWAQTIPVPPSTPYSLSINGSGSSGSAGPGLTMPFTFNYYDQVNGATDIAWGQVELLDANQNAHCALSWGRPSALSLYDGIPSYSTSFGVDQSDSYCTVSLVSIVNSPSDPSAVSVTLNFTFGETAGGTYSVISQVYDAEGFYTPWGTVGSFNVFPDPGASIPNSFTASPNPLTCNDITGSWQDTLPSAQGGAQWNLTWDGSSAGGTMQRIAFTQCGVSTYNTISGSLNGNTFTVSASQPTNQLTCDPNLYVVSTTVTETVTISGPSCSTSAAQWNTFTPGIGNVSGTSSWQATTNHYVISVSSYIPVDHIAGPTFCLVNGVLPTSYGLLYKGDAFRNTYRTTQSVLAIPDISRSYGFYPNTGPTRNYSDGSPANGLNSNLDSTPTDPNDLYNAPYVGRDEDPYQGDCILWNAKGKAETNLMQNYQVTFPASKQVSVLLTGTGRDPLEPQIGGINWSTVVVVDNSNPAAPQAYVNYSHTCYPAFNVKVNGTTIYDSWRDRRYPEKNTPVYLLGCLLPGAGQVTGQSQPVVVPRQ